MSGQMVAGFFFGIAATNAFWMLIMPRLRAWREMS
jgi:hypothetical protein